MIIIWRAYLFNTGSVRHRRMYDSHCIISSKSGEIHKIFNKQGIIQSNDSLSSLMTRWMENMIKYNMNLIMLCVELFEEVSTLQIIFKSFLIKIETFSGIWNSNNQSSRKFEIKPLKISKNLNECQVRFIKIMCVRYNKIFNNCNYCYSQNLFQNRNLPWSSSLENMCNQPSARKQ